MCTQVTRDVSQSSIVCLDQVRVLIIVPQILVLDLVYLVTHVHTHFKRYISADTNTTYVGHVCCVSVLSSEVMHV